MVPRIRSDGDEANTTNAQLGAQGEGGLAAINGEKTLAELAQQYEVHANQITALKAQLTEGAAGVFGPGGLGNEAVPVVDLKVLHTSAGHSSELRSGSF